MEPPIDDVAIACMNTSDADLSTEQKHALESALKQTSILITGPGGTGKTFLIRRIVRRLREIGKIVAVTALTGAAASLITDIGARTLHSWGGILARDDISAEDKATRIMRKRDLRDRWRDTDVLIIDEVSMMSPKLAIDADVIARRVRGSQRGYKERAKKPFGGLQIIFVGDFFQLPPVLKGGEEKTFLFETTEKERVAKTLPPFSRIIRSKKQVIVLRKNFRQADDTPYLSMLSRARYGKITDDDAVMLRTRLLSNLIKTGVNPRELDVKPTWLLPTRRQVDDINKREMDALDSSIEFTYTPTTMSKRVIVVNSGDAETEPEMITTWDEFTREPRDYLDIDEDDDPDINPGKITEALAIVESDKSGQYDPELKLRIGAQVMVTANLDMERGIVNGTRGVIIELSCGGAVLRLRNGKRLTVKPKVFETAHSRIGRRQLPLILAWAVTIHKSQGQTLDCAEIDLGSRVFADGQAYVALSRVRSLDGLFLRTFSRSAIRASPVVCAFASAIGDTPTIMGGNSSTFSTL